MHPKLLEQKREARAKELKDLREKHGISKSVLAAYSGLMRKTIDNIENATGTWTVDSEIIYIATLEKLK